MDSFIMNARNKLNKSSIFIFIFLFCIIINLQGVQVTARDEYISGHIFTDPITGGEGTVRYFLPENNTYSFTSNVDIDALTMTVGSDISNRVINSELFFS